MSNAGDVVLTRWWWVRHAPVREDGGCIYGQSDLGCDCSDRVAFEGLANALPKNAVWFASHLKRTHQTAQAIFDVGFPKPAKLTHDERFAEQNLGEWQGLDRAQFYKNLGDQLGSFWFGPADQRAPGGESFVDMCERTRVAIAEVNAAHAGRDIVVVSHGGVIKAALAHALGLGPQGGLSFTVENCSLTQLDHRAKGGRDGWRIGMVNHQPWIVPSDHREMHRPDGPEVKLA